MKRDDWSQGLWKKEGAFLLSYALPTRSVEAQAQRTEAERQKQELQVRQKQDEERRIQAELALTRKRFDEKSQRRRDRAL